jgi:hypothetical protein
MDTPALRSAVQSTQPMRIAFELRLGQSKTIYDALNALNATALRSTLNDGQLRLLSMTLTDYRNSGVGLAPAQRARFNTIINQLQQLSTNYTNNVLDSTKVTTATTAAAAAAAVGEMARQGTHTPGILLAASSACAVKSRHFFEVHACVDTGDTCCCNSATGKMKPSKPACTTCTLPMLASLYLLQCMLLFVCREMHVLTRPTAMLCC